MATVIKRDCYHSLYENEWHGVMGTVPNQSFKVKIKGYTCGYLGMAPQQPWELSNGVEMPHNHGWYLYLELGHLYGCSGWVKQIAEYSDSVRDGSVVEVLFNKERREISYAINGVNKGLAYINLPAEDLYPSLLLQNSGSVKLLR